MARPPRTRFAAPFVMVVTTAAGGCADGKGGGGTTTPPDDRPKPQRTWSVQKRADGTCWGNEPMSCPKNATCNPPAPMAMPCPPDAKQDDWFTVVSFDGKTCVLDGTQTAVTCPSYDYQPPRPPPPPTVDAAVATAPALRRWTVERGQKDCWAAIDPDPCTQLNLKPGDPIPPCNPPAPAKIECPKPHVVAIVETAKDTCETQSDAKCDPGVKCNPPPPAPTPCPRY